MGCKDDTSLQGPCADTTLDGDGAGSVKRIFPSDDGTGVPTELPLWDSIASEPTRMSGTSFRIYSVRRAKHRHPLYAEPSSGGQWEYHGPWEMMGALIFAQASDSTTSVDSSGKMETSTATLYVARKEFERVEAPDPKIGDVIHVWGKMPFGVSQQFWDIVSDKRDDETMFTSEAFVQYRLSLTRRTSFDPGRKVFGMGAETPTREAG